MKSIYVLLAAVLLLGPGCKKSSDSARDNQLKIIVSGVTSGSYSISIKNHQTGLSIWGVDYKTDNTTYETKAAPGDVLDVTTALKGKCTITFKYNGNMVGTTTGNASESRNVFTIHIN